jgi:hypothetical protein
MGQGMPSGSGASCEIGRGPGLAVPHAMKKKSHPASPPPINEDAIRAYAEHLFEQSGRIPNRDLDNWLEAKACLEANLPPGQSHVRLHRHRESARRKGFTMPSSDASLWIERRACAESDPCTVPRLGDEATTSCPMQADPDADETLPLGNNRPPPD